MLAYWILRDRNDAPIGLVRVWDDRVLLKPNETQSFAYRLFSERTDAPIEPFIETVFAEAAALIGYQNGKPCAFAAAPDAKPISVYLDRLSHICTIQAKPETVLKPTEEPAEDAAPAEEETPDLPDISDTAREAEAFARLLRLANDFYARVDRIHTPAVDNLVHKEDNSAEAERGIDLFPAVFPGARWRYVESSSVIGHYEGDYRYPDGERVRILAVRGRCAPRPPRTLSGFTRFLRAADGTGYWLRILPLG